MTIEQFSAWLQGTSLSALFVEAGWIVPAVQTIHILSVAMVMASAGMFYLRLLQIIRHPISIAEMAQRFLPWIWRALTVLLITGVLLVIAEPNRELLNDAFRLKMLLVLTAVPLTLALQVTLKRNVEFWSLSQGRRTAARGIAVVSFLLWTTILTLGRWIAYYQGPVG